MARRLPPAPSGFKYVFRPWKRDRRGGIVYASSVGKRVWVFLVPDKEHSNG